MPYPQPQRFRDDRGFTFVEVVCVLCFLALALLALAAAVGSGMGTAAVNREEDVAAHAARQALEQLQDPDGLPFEMIFAAYNADPDDDPAGYDSPGPEFAVTGVRDGKGEILFPTEGGELREDVAGRDLDGDTKLDDLDHAADYVLLPVTVRIRWNGVVGDRSVEFTTVLGKR